MMRKTVVTAVGSAVLGGLGVGYLTLGPTAHADRSAIVDDSTTTTVAGTTDAGSGTSDTPTAGDQDPDQRFRDHVHEALAPLLADGTLTQDQIDKVVDALATARPERGPGGPGGPGHGRRGHGPMIQAREEVVQVVADTIGISVDDVTTALRGGQTIADLAKAHGVDPQKVIDALVLDATKAIDAKVADGTISSDKAAEIKTNLVERITTFVNEGGPRMRGQGPGHPDDAPDQTPTTTTSGS